MYPSIRTCIVGIVLSLFLTGCYSIGPKTIQRDRFKYGEAITDSREEQLLMNMVRLRYGEAPLFLKVTSVIAQYVQEGEVGYLKAFDDDLIGDALNLKGGGKWSDRPTITYTPLSGQEFTRNLLTPIQPATVFSMIEAGWPIERMMRLSTQSVNGVSSRVPGSNTLNSAYFDVLEIFHDLQEEEALVIIKDPEVESGITLEIKVEELNAQQLESVVTLKEILRLDPTINQFEIVISGQPKAPQQIALLTRSIMEIMVELSGYFEVPQELIDEGFTYDTVRPDPADPRQRIPIRVLSAKEKSPYAAIAVFDRGYWYVIDDRDYPSKNMFSLMLMLMSLTESEMHTKGPLVTIGADG